ncbi:hypothetical protein [Deinococcus humi]|uniref:Uncharacterized protein n=1 Tax=Deinococcus humi TaxID=662880 RepID=A0A7W8NH85_9DEIO|nr:hypothetical protein [Deinococcus humi]MBB5366301.1 hypothetical protein [Deinococcus humi]
MYNYFYIERYSHNSVFIYEYIFTDHLLFRFPLYRYAGRHETAPCHPIAALSLGASAAAQDQQTVTATDHTFLDRKVAQFTKAFCFINHEQAGFTQPGISGKEL